MVKFIVNNGTQILIQNETVISPRPYKSKLTHGEALQMILNGECGSFSQPLLYCFMEAAMQKEWIKKADS